MGRKKENVRRLGFSVYVPAYEVLSKDARDRGYVNGNGLMWRSYFGAIAAQIAEGKINVPGRVVK